MSNPTVRPDADDEWENLLHQLRTQASAPLRPYFYHRVQARLAVETRRPWLPGWVRRPAYALLLGALVLALSGDDAALAAGAAPAPTTAPAPR